MPNFADRLLESCAPPHAPLCVGLDPVPERIPDSLGGDLPARTERFCRELIDALEGIVPLVKPQSAYFEALGPQGAAVLARVLYYAREKGYLTICDAKRGDIGSTSVAYARAYLGESAPYPADAITVNPYLGSDAVMPFVEEAQHSGKGVFILCKTSNPGSGELQDQMLGNQPLYVQVAKLVDGWGSAVVGEMGFSSVGAVVGATYPEVLGTCRLFMPRAIFLLPGVGAQGGSARQLRLAFDEHGRGGLIVSARDIIYAFERKDLSRYYAPNQFDAAAREAATLLRDQIGEMLGSR